MSGRHMDCDDCFEHLDDYLDRELSKEEIAAVEQHLAECTRCSEEFVVERELLDCIKERLRGVTLPPQLAARIRERLESE